MTPEAEISKKEIRERQTTKTVDFEVKKDDHIGYGEHDYFPANDEPDNETAIIYVNPSSGTSVKRLIFRFYWRSWVEPYWETSGVKEYELFKGIKPGDKLRLTYPSYRNFEPTSLYVDGGNSDAPVSPNNASPFWLLENLTQGWRIER